MAREPRGDFYPLPIVDQNTRPGAVTRLIVFVVVLTGAAIVFGIFRERLGDPFLLGMLGVLAMIGVGYLFATAIGFVQIAPRSTTDELSKAFVDSMSQGLLVTDTKGRVVYANKAYGEMTGAFVCRRHQDGREPAVRRAGGVARRSTGSLRASGTGSPATASSGCRRPSGRAPSRARAGTG